jgi:hypothetical protein
MPDQSPPRRRFQFRLRTLMIVVAVLALPCAYVGWQAKIVRERRAMLTRIFELDGSLLTVKAAGDFTVCEYPDKIPTVNRGLTISWFQTRYEGKTVVAFSISGNGSSDDIPKETSWIRGLLGDEQVIAIYIPASVPQGEATRIADAFPEATMSRTLGPFSE